MESLLLRLEMSKFYKGHSMDASYQVSYHLAKRFQWKNCFRNRPIRNKNCLWWPCLLTDQNGMSNSHRCFLPRNMATTGDSCFWLADFLDSSPLKPFSQMNRNLVGSIYGKSSVFDCWFRPDPLTKMATTNNFCLIFLEIDQSETRIDCGGHVCQWIGTKWALFLENHP
jgi:hypothetical protein